MASAIHLFASFEFEAPPFSSSLTDRFDLRSTFPTDGQPFKIFHLIFLPIDR
jgi:hypothetical protein